MAQIRFYRGASGVTLPSFQDGAVFIVANGARKDKIPLGDMYVDVPGDNNAGQRLHIIPEDAIYYKTASDWSSSEEWGDISVANKVYVKINVVTNNDVVVKREPQIAIGDGVTAVGNLDFQTWNQVLEAATATPSAVGTLAAKGTSDKYALEDHIHNIDRDTITAALNQTIGTAASKNVVTAVTSASEDLPTSKAVEAAITAAASSVLGAIPSASITVPKKDSGTTGTVGTDTTWARGDHIHPVDDSRAPKSHASTATTYGIGTSANYGHVKLSDALDGTSTAASGIAATPKAVKDAIAAAASAATQYANQNAFSNIVVGSSTIAADSVTDSFTISAGDNISLTPDTTNDKITISATDTTYSAGTTAATNIATTSSAGTTAAGTPYAAWNHQHAINSTTITSALGYTPVNPNIIGANSGIAQLGADGKVPTSQLPSYVDDVIEVANYASLPTNASAETGKIYITTNDNRTYRWSGTGYAEISSSLALGTTSETAYAGDQGAENRSRIETLEATITSQGDTLSSLGDLAFKDNATTSYQPAGTLNITLPTASKNIVSSVSTGSVVTGVTTAAQTMVTGVTTATQTVATGGSATSITVTGEVLNIPESIITSIATTSINKVTAVNTASKNVVSSVSTGTAVTAVTTAAQTMVTGQPSTKTFTGTTATITVS